MKYFKINVCVIILALCTIIFSGCSVIKTNKDNREFAKNMVWSEYIDSNPVKIKFENNYYILSENKLPKNSRGNRIGIVSKNNSTHYWIYSIKEVDQTKAIALYISGEYYEATSEK